MPQRYQSRFLGSMKNLIVTADDFGASVEVNAAIERDHRAGLITQASLMVNEPGAEEAVIIARRNPKLCVGLHLALCDGKASRASTLTDARGNFAPSPARAGLRYFFSTRIRAALEVEIEAQFARFLALDFAPSYWDGHHHLHLHPTVVDLTLPIAHRAGFRAVRLVCERGSFRPVAFVFERLSRRLLPRLRENGIHFSERIYGLRRSGRMDTQYFERTLNRLPDGTSEIYCHPGAERLEIDAARIARRARELDIRLTDFRDLPV